MTQISSIDLPTDSALHPHIAPDDFVDCYSVRATLSARSAAEVIATFPGWVKALMHLRNGLVSPFGLLPEGPQSADKIGPFPVTSETEHEIIAGFDDKHLDFRISVRAKDGTVSLATWVHRHNVLGRSYLTLIMPFHVLIARNALARVARAQT